jgi:hypothetical protein
MKQLIAAILCLMIPTCAFAADNGYKVVYDGGSLPGLKAGTTIKLYVEPTQVRLYDDKEKKDLIVIPASSITEVSYGQDVHRRIGTAIGLAVISLGIGALMMFSKSKKHFIGTTWANGEQKGGLAMQCDKNEYRGILAAMEGVSGKKAVNSDTMAVKN